eukprot:sb/3476121/
MKRCLWYPVRNFFERLDISLDVGCYFASENVEFSTQSSSASRRVSAVSGGQSGGTVLAKCGSGGVLGLTSCEVRCKIILPIFEESRHTVTPFPFSCLVIARLPKGRGIRFEQIQTRLSVS